MIDNNDPTIKVNYNDGTVTEHDNIEDALFIMRNVSHIQNTTIKSVIGDDEVIKDLRCTAIILNGYVGNFK